MTLRTIGRMVSERRGAKGLTLHGLAAEAEVGRSTLAALEGGKLRELGFAKLTRICEALDLTVEARPLTLPEPLMKHRHLTATAGRELTKAAIEDVVVRGDIEAWRGLVRAIRQDRSGALSRRAREVVRSLDPNDPKVRAFAILLPDLLKSNKAPTNRNG